ARQLAADKEPRVGSKRTAGLSPGTLSFIWPQDPKARRSRHRGPAEKITTTFCGCVARLGRSTSDGSVVHVSQRRGELSTRAHAELAKNAAEMRLDRAQGNEQRLCDLGVAEAFRGHCRDPVLARGERVDAAGGKAPRPCPAGDQLLVGMRGEERRAATLSQLERQPQRLARRRPLVPTPQRGAEVSQRVRIVETSRRRLEDRNRLLQPLQPLGPSLDDDEDPQRLPERPWCAPPARELELLARLLMSGAAFFEEVVGEGNLGVPGEPEVDCGIDEADPLGDTSGRERVSECRAVVASCREDSRPSTEHDRVIAAFLARRTALSLEGREHSCGFVGSSALDKDMRQEAVQPWREERLGGRPRVERSANVRLGVDQRTACTLQRTTPKRRVRERERTAPAPSPDDDILDEPRRLPKAVAEEQDVEEAPMRKQPLGVLTQVYQGARGIRERALPIGAANRVVIRAQSENETGSRPLRRIELERVEPCVRT